MVDKALTLRERNRARARAEIAEAALRLFDERGFEGVTIDDITAAAGVSRRTFFRYFDTKEDALLADYVELTDRLTSCLSQPGGDPVEALRAALHRLVDWYEERSEAVLQRSRVLQKSLNPSARNLEFLSTWEKAIASSLASRTGQEAAGLLPRAAAAAIVGAFRAALTQWVRSGCQTDLHELTDRAMDLVANGVERALGPADSPQ